MAERTISDAARGCGVNRRTLPRAIWASQPSPWDAPQRQEAASCPATT